MKYKWRIPFFILCISSILSCKHESDELYRSILTQLKVDTTIDFIFFLPENPCPFCEEKLKLILKLNATKKIAVVFSGMSEKHLRFKSKEYEDIQKVKVYIDSSQKAILNALVNQSGSLYQISDEGKLIHLLDITPNSVLKLSSYLE